MKYYVVRADITKGGTENTEIKSFDNYDSAIKFYHLCFSNNISAEKKVCTLLTDENLNKVEKGVWQEAEESEESEE